MLYWISVTERGLTGIANIFRSRLSRLDDLLGAGTHGSLETFGGPQRHAIAHLKAGKMVIPNMSSVMLGKSVLF